MKNNKLNLALLVLLLWLYLPSMLMASANFNLDTINSLLSMGFGKITDNPEIDNAIRNGIDDGIANEIIGGEDFKDMQSRYPDKFGSVTSPNELRDALADVVKNDPDVAIDFLKQNKTAANEIFGKFLANEDMRSIYRTVELVKMKHMEYVRSLHWNYERQNLHLINWIGDDMDDGRYDSKIFIFSLELLNLSIFAQRNSILSTIAKVLSSGDTSSMNDFNAVLNLIQKVDMNMMMPLDLATIGAEFILIPGTLSMGYALNFNTNFPYVTLNIKENSSSKNGFDLDLGLSLVFNWNNILYTKYRFLNRNNIKMSLNSGITYSHKFCEYPLWQLSGRTNGILNNNYSANGFSIFSKLIFLWNLSDIPYVNWFFSGINISDTLWSSFYFFDFSFNTFYFNDENGRSNFNITTNHINMNIHRRFGSSNSFNLTLSTGMDFSSRFGNSSLFEEDYEKSKAVMSTVDIPGNIFNVYFAVDITLWYVTKIHFIFGNYLKGFQLQLIDYKF